MPASYPHVAPAVRFVDPGAFKLPRHPHVRRDGRGRGSVCPVSVGLNEWAPSHTLSRLLHRVVDMLQQCAKDMPAEKRNEIRAQFEKHLVDLERERAAARSAQRAAVTALAVPAAEIVHTVSIASSGFPEEFHDAEEAGAGSPAAAASPLPPTHAAARNLLDYIRSVGGTRTPLLLDEGLLKVVGSEPLRNDAHGQVYEGTLGAHSAPLAPLTRVALLMLPELSPAHTQLQEVPQVRT